MAKKSYSFRLLKTHIADPADALKDGHKLLEKPLSDAPENKRLFAGQSYSGPPGWVSFFAADDRAQFEGLFGGQAAALLFIRAELAATADQPAEQRWLALCFGMGFQELRPEALESQFGLKVALNRLGRERIKSIDTRRPEDATIQTRSQSSRTGEIFDFGIETNRTILQAITGKSQAEDFGGTLTGSDGLKISCETHYGEIDAKALQILTSFNDTAYEEHFPWYGKITPIKDRTRIEGLQATLLQRLVNGELDGIHLSPPEIVDFQTIDRFKFSGSPRNDEQDELRLSDYLALFGEDRPLTLEHLQSDKVRVAAEDGPFHDRWPVLKCISAEVYVDDVLHILAAGDWYSVRADFVGEINQSVADIPAVELGLPSYNAGEAEGAFNLRAVEGRDDVFLYDKNLVNFEGERGRVEFCDLLTNGRHIVHVKRRSRSSTLSHLFLQGHVSAEAFLDYPPLRAQIREAMPAIVGLIPEERPNPSDYQVVFTFLHEGNATLPFFSKVALSSVVRQLRRMSFGVSLCWIGIA
ncbi:MAG: hypothetical protein ABS75_00015 [Pelagibacterium sp. SCN 63-23]|nr:MAG: hypothetical protein ABS75_00015 [Pelagibacterium sp. SCN 63-23]